MEGKMNNPLIASGPKYALKRTSKKKDTQNADMQLSSMSVSALPSCSNVKTKDKFNPCMELDKLRIANGWFYPTYSFSPETKYGQHGYSCVATIMSYSGKGYGTSTLSAKWEAARRLLVAIHAPKETKNYIKSSIPLAQVEEFYEMLKSGKSIPSLSSENLLDMLRFCRDLRSDAKKKLASLQTLNVDKLVSTDYHAEQMLQDISKEQDLTVSYKDYEEKTPDGYFRCSVQLSELPINIYGVGQSQQEARSAAAYNALQYLKILTRN